MAEVTVTVSKCNEQELVLHDDDSAAVTVTVTGNNKIAPAAQEQQQQQLEGKKKRLLEELESAFTTIATPKPNNNSNSSLGFEVIDETALLDCIPNTKPRRKPSKNTILAPPRTTGTDTVTHKKKNKYSREMMESMRFVNVSQQHKFWKTIYTALQSAFADEYDTLVVASAAAHNNRHALPFLPNKKPILTGVGAANGRCRYVNVFVH